MPAYLIHQRTWYSVPLAGTHSDLVTSLGYDTLADAIADSCARLRDHGDKVCIQAGTERQARRYLREYLKTRKCPQLVTAEWPGTYCEWHGNDIAENLL